jgi:selenocysteine lyase/cysteine desulfurase
VTYLLDACQAVGQMSTKVAELGCDVRDPAAIVTFSIGNRDADGVKTEFALAGFNVSVSHPSSTLLDAEARRLPSVVRASPHYYNTEDEISRFIEATRAAASRA